MSPEDTSFKYGFASRRQSTEALHVRIIALKKPKKKLKQYKQDLRIMNIIYYATNVDNCSSFKKEQFIEMASRGSHG